MYDTFLQIFDSLGQKKYTRRDTLVKRNFEHTKRDVSFCCE